MDEMTLEQEVASIMAFVLLHAGNSHPYYDEVPEQFKFPAVYFPQPEIGTRGETFRTYASEYAWYINIMATSTPEAHAIGLAVLSKLKGAKNCVPVISEDGKPTGENLRLKDPSLRKIETGVEQLTIEWTSRRPYDATEALKMLRFHLNFEDKSEEEATQNGDQEE